MESEYLVQYLVYRGEVLLSPNPEPSSPYFHYADVPIGQHTYTVVAEYANGVSPAVSVSLEIYFLVVPSNFSLSVENEHDVLLTWEAPIDINPLHLMGYTLSRDAVVLIETPANVLTFSENELPFGQHTYFLFAVYENGVSEAAELVAELYQLFPAQNLVAVEGDAFVLLSWEAGAENINHLTGYIIYRDNELFTALSLPLAELSFTDSAVTNDITYEYYVTAVYGNGESPASNTVSATPHTTDEEDLVSITKTELYDNYPNPFNPSTNIRFGLKNDSVVTILIYNVRGQKVRELLSQNLKQGKQSVTWDGKDDFGQNVSSGIYFYVMKKREYSAVKKMMLLK